MVKKKPKTTVYIFEEQAIVVREERFFLLGLVMGTLLSLTGNVAITIGLNKELMADGFFIRVFILCVIFFICLLAAAIERLWQNNKAFKDLIQTKKLFEIGSKYKEKAEEKEKEGISS